MSKPCTRREVLSKIRDIIEKSGKWEKLDGFKYKVEGEIDVLEILSVFTTHRDLLLSDLMDKLTGNDTMDKEDIMEVIAHEIMGFNNKG